MKTKLRATSHTALLSLGLALGAALPALVTPMVATAQALPAPYISRALDAVLLPIDDAVADAFGLGPDVYGVLILATQPGGWADAAGIVPGDVIETVQKHHIADPIQIDEVVLYWLNQGTSDFAFDIWRDGQLANSSWTLTQDSYSEVIEITTVASWSSYSSSSFSYESWYSEYSETLSESYSSSETLIEETITSEEFTSEVTSEETSTEEMTTEQTTSDEAGTDAAGTDAAGTDEAGADAAGADAAGTDDASMDAGADEGGDAGVDEGGDAGTDDSGGDSSGDEG